MGKVEETLVAIEESNARDLQYRNILRINACLPKHKERRINAVTTGYLVRRRNSSEKLKNLYKSMDQTEHAQLRAKLFEAL